MPPRTIEESHRPRASDRTMHCHSSSGQSYRLVVSENDGRRHNSEMEPQGRTIASPSRTRRQSKTLCLEKTTLRRRDYVQTVGLNAETKKDRHRAEGEIFVLTFPLIGSSGLLFQKTMAAVTTTKWNRRGEPLILRFTHGDKAKPFAWRRPLSDEETTFKQLG